MCLQAIRCNIQEFCCNGLQGVTWSYMALQVHLVCVTAIFFAIMSKLPVMADHNVYKTVCLSEDLLVFSYKIRAVWADDGDRPL
jgi:hypothetical protein